MKPLKVITFYSYKGGTGRSLAAAQLGVLLARFGKRTVVLDLDIEAPGLLSRVAASFSIADTPERGLVEHIKEFLTHSKSAALSPIPSLEVTSLLRLILPGDPARGTYWEAVRALRSLEPPAGEGSELDRAPIYFGRLKDAIEAQFQCEYLIIDSPSGFTPLSGFCTTILPDDVVVLTTLDADCLAGTHRFGLIHENRVKSNKLAPSRLHYSLSRFPSLGSPRSEVESEIASESIEAEALEHVRGEVSKRRLRVGDVVVLHSEPRLQLGRWGIMLPVPYAGPPEQSPIVEDYCSLFRAVVPEVREQLADLSKSVRRFKSYYMVDSGKMINPIDRERNVAFRLDTLQALVEGLVQKGRGRVSGKEFYDELYRAGYDAAARFSEYLAGKWAADQLEKTPEERAQEWCEFDSSVGFGRFDASVWTGSFKGEITLENNFLIAGRTSRDPSLCGFMVGYVARVLESVYPGKTITVRHLLKADCGQFATNEAGAPKCVYHFAAKGERAGGRPRGKAKRA